MQETRLDFKEDLLPKPASPANSKRNGAKVKRHPRHRSKVLIVLGVVGAVLVALLIYGIVTAANTPPSKQRKPPPDPEVPLPPSYSRLTKFTKAAVCTDGPVCSEIGKSILEKNGSVIDATVAAVFCNGLYNMHSMGIGGGFFMTVYIKEELRAYSVNAREVAPGASTSDMFATNAGTAFQTLKGPKAVAVPGEVRGMWAVHQRWGKLPWADLLQPSIDLCYNGFNMSKSMYDAIKEAPFIQADPSLKKTYFDERSGKPRRAGSLVKVHKSLCETLERLAKNGGDDFYNGTLAQDILNDLKAGGSIITADDLSRYQPKISEPVAIPLKDGHTLYTPPPPSSGVLLGYIMNILSGYNFTETDIADENSTILTYHRIIEAFKFAFATRTKLGDADFVDIKKLIANLSSTDYVASIRAQINDTVTSNDPSYYGAEFSITEDRGTAHMSIVAPNGDAVSLTSSINYYFGSGMTTARTGIVLNNVMDDFSSPNVINYFGVKPSPANYIKPYKRPMSSMSPAIIVDKNYNVKMVIGASGGTKIITAIALVAMRTLWFNQSVKEAVDAPRLHHQLYPMSIDYEYGNLKGVIEGLKQKGHNVTRYSDRGSVICGLYRNMSGIYGNADHRKGGEVYGLDY